MSRMTSDTSPTLVIEKRLGAGSYGTVYKGKWGVFTVAAKKFHISANEVAQDSIQREIKTLEALSYRHVIQFYGTVYHRGQLVLLTDLAEGGSLALAIRNGIKDWSTKERFAREMLLGLAYIHSKGVLHLDLKSENVLLSHLMEVKLCDFGCSTIKTTSATRSTESHRGTVRWTAPEIFVPKPKYSTKSDMYSLGMVMWEMAANCTTPFNSHRDNSIIISLVKDGAREELPEDTPVEYRSWVERCWDKDPSKRPEAMEYFQEAKRAEKREGTPDDTHETDKISGGRDMTGLISFGFDGLSVLSHLADEEDVGSNTSSNKSMVAKQRTVAHKSSPIEYVRASVNSSRSHSIFGANEQYSHHRSSGQSDTDQAVGVEDSNHIRRLSSDFDMLSSLLALSEKNEKGRGVERSDVETVEWCTKAANHGDPDAQYNLGLMYDKGRGVEQSKAKAFKWYTKAANQGNAAAQTNLGSMYRNGHGVEQSDAKAVEWYTKAANQGNATAQFNLGLMYDNGRGVEQSDTKAFKWYTKAANQGDAAAQINLGLMYRNGHGVEQIDTKAVEWFTKAANQGDATAQTNLGLMYINGHGVEQSDAKAVEWYTKAANQGNATAQINLGWMYDNGRGVEQSDTKAFKWYTKAANQGDVTAQINLGLMYRNGHGVEQSDAKAVEWFTKAANQGNAAAQTNLGSMYRNGHGVEQSNAKAVEWYTKAANQGNATAQINLGWMYDNGRGVEQSDTKAFKWYTKAANQGDAAAQINLGLMYRNGRGVEQNDVKAIEWFTKAANQDNAAAQIILRLMYRNGQGLSRMV